MIAASLPRLITFDGEARSGKGTIVSCVKDYLREDQGYNVMLIDAGQVFRVLVVAAARAQVNMEDPAAIDAFLGDKAEAEKCVQLVKEVYRMDKDVRDTLLYTNEVGANSAKVGARPLSQAFKDELLKKWLRDARVEGYQIVLLDGRALEETGGMLEREGLCDFALGLYFTCDPRVGACRTLGFAAREYEELTNEEKNRVDTLVGEINERNRKDRERAVQPIVPPSGALTYLLPDVPSGSPSEGRPMVIFDTSAKITKSAMGKPVAEFIAKVLKR